MRSNNTEPDPPQDSCPQDLPLPGAPPTLREWLRAWRSVLRHPDKTIPLPRFHPEGEPVPAELGLHCPACGYSLTGLIEWRCPECGQRFSLRHAYLQQMLRQPEYFLRYRYDPRDIRRVFWGIVLLVGGGAMGIAGGAILSCFGLMLLLAFGTIGGVLLALRPVVDVSEPSMFFNYALVWFMIWLALLILA